MEHRHTPHPSGYLAHHEWAEKMLLTHEQLRCPGCALFEIWVKKRAEHVQAYDDRVLKAVVQVADSPDASCPGWALVFEVYDLLGFRHANHVVRAHVPASLRRQRTLGLIDSTRRTGVSVNLWTYTSDGLERVGEELAA